MNKFNLVKILFPLHNNSGKTTQMETRIIRLENTKHLKEYRDYGVDTEGNVWSFKYKKPRILSPGWKKKNHGYRTVLLSHRNGTKKNFLVHRIVAMAFIPTEDITMEVNHRNRNSSDNRLENLEWVSRKKNIEHNAIVNGFSVDDFVMAKIKEVHSASIRKGLPVPNSYEFMNSIIEGALEQYINQYGLRKVMHTLPVPQQAIKKAPF